MQCPGCQATVAIGAKFCAECGRPLPRACPTCGHASPGGARFCPECGASLAANVATQAAEPKAATPALAAAAPERRQLSVMFCDMVGSSALSTRLDPEEQREVVSSFQTCCATEIKRLGGMVAQYLGDGVLAYFGYPAAHEDDAERAVRAGLSILSAMGNTKSAQGAVLQARIGIATGVVVVGDLVREGVTQENAAIGETTNLAARLQTLAEPDALLICPDTHRVIGKLFEYRDLGRHDLKGFARPVHVRQVSSASKVENRFEARQADVAFPLLGRDEELELLLRRWEQAKRSEGRVVLLTGEAGIGKSRLTRALQERLREDPHTLLTYHCSPYHQDSALYPVIGQFTRATGIGREDTAAVKLEKLEALLSQSSGNLTDDVPLLAALLSIPLGEPYELRKATPQRLKELTLRALISQLARLATRQPVLMVFEDLHWVDPTSLELLSLAIDQIRGQRVLLLATSRPDFTPPWPSHRHISTISLSRLDKTEGKALVAGVTGGKSLPGEVLDQIVARTDGVPLFIEELTKTVLESGLLREADDHYELTGPLPPLAIPSTLHASLLARLDRLASVKDMAQIGAVIGREFSFPLIAAVAALPEKDLKIALAQLVSAELIFQRGVPPDATYQFKHALVQDASYASLVRSRRQQLHGQIAHALEERFPDSMSTEPETLAYHFTEAGLLESAVGYWLRAGSRAIAASAIAEAVAHFSNGLNTLVQLPDSAKRQRQEFDLRQPLAGVLMAAKGWTAPEVRQQYVRCRELAEQLGDSARMLYAMRGLWSAQHVRGEHDAALVTARQMAVLAEECGDVAGKWMAQSCLGLSSFMRGAVTSALDHLERALTLDDPQMAGHAAAFAGQDISIHALTYASRALTVLGYTDKARARIGETFARAKMLHHAPSSAFAYSGAAVVYALTSETERLAKVAEEMLALATEHKFPYWVAIGLIFQGHVQAESGNAAQGIRTMHEGLTAYENLGMRQLTPFFLCLYASAHLKAADVEGGMLVDTKALSLVDDTGERWCSAELHRLKGELLLAGDKPRAGEAEASLLRAIGIAQEQSARFLELRAAVSLARLWCEQGKLHEARNLLGSVYSWFTEGFDTVDLKDANALLNKLNA